MNRTRGISEAQQKALDRLRTAAHGKEADWVIVITTHRAFINGNWYPPNTIIYEGQSEIVAAERLVPGTTFAKHQQVATARLLALEAAENVQKGRVPNRV